MVEAQGISVMPGDVFSNTDHFANAIRLNCALPWSDAIEEGLGLLGELAQRLASA